ncbi:MAG: SHOCT domain-containing protein [Ferruginibacter sp.]|nr:SHOCT domain-containing protein [Ferruginibacter sp.]
MKKILFFILLCPLFTSAQNTLPRFQHDTLYTSGGYKIYKGQVLHLANGTSEAGYFKYIKFRMYRTDTYNLQNSSIEVDKLKRFKNSGQDDYSIMVFGKVTYKAGKQEEIEIVLYFDDAINADELTVPAEFKKQIVKIPATEIKEKAKPVETKTQEPSGDLKNLMIANEIKKLYDLYKQGALTKEEYESQKKKLLERQ